jgi:predicted helicase
LLDWFCEELVVATQRPASEAETAWLVAQAIVHSRQAWERADPRLHRAAAEFDIFPPSATLLGRVLRLAVGGDLRARDNSDVGPKAVQAVGKLLAEMPRSSETATKANGSATIHPYDFDAWLGAHDHIHRARWGVFYTPTELAEFVVRGIDGALSGEFGLRRGLADTSSWGEVARRWTGRADPMPPADAPFVRILDPALGTGVFLVAVIDQVFRSKSEFWRKEGLDEVERRQAWSGYVTRSLLPRLAGQELLLPSAVVAWIRLAEKLAVTGMSGPAWTGLPLDVRITDTLARAGSAGTNGMPSTAGLTAARDEQDVERSRWSGDVPYTVLLGNPPFSALSTSDPAAIHELLRSRILGRRDVGSYFEVDGVPLGEKKMWLHDDYIKFLRWAQWQVERAGCGIVGMVTNHGYLDNVTFRGVRRSLLATFPLISVLDLHGNRKKHERAPSGPRDENVFGIEQGVAIGLLRRPPQPIAGQVQYGELWGGRGAKLSALADGAGGAGQPVAPAAPYYFFSPSGLAGERSTEYERGFPLTEVMPVYTSAAVTARDGLVVAFTSEELCDRLQQLADPRYSDDDIRARLLPVTRSSRYPPGETRGWKLAAARERARAVGDFAKLVRTVQYRPFDRRAVAWADWLIDWPRSRVTRHLLLPGNCALVTRRQMLPGHPCNYFFITDTPVIDGLIRSDNRGNESFFPLYLAPPQDQIEPGGSSLSCPNLSAEWIARCQQAWPLRWLPAGRGDLGATIGPADMLALFYAQFHSRAYRQRYAEQLRVSFPRVFLPRDPELLAALCRLGQSLVEVHLRPERNALGTACHTPANGGTAAAPVVIGGRYPCWNGKFLHVAENYQFTEPSEEVWNYRIGVHQVCRKWLRDRSGRVLTERDLTHYHHMVGSVRVSLALEAEINDTIDMAGGWPTAFMGR